MSTTSWTLDRACLKRALADWHATGPDAETRERVNEWLMDLVKNPLHRGNMDPDHPGIGFGRIAGTNVGVTFVAEREAAQRLRRVYRLIEPQRILHNKASPLRRAMVALAAAVLLTGIGLEVH